MTPMTNRSAVVLPTTPAALAAPARPYRSVAEAEAHLAAASSSSTAVYWAVVRRYNATPGT